MNALYQESRGIRFAISYSVLDSPQISSKALNALGDYYLEYESLEGAIPALFIMLIDKKHAEDAETLQGVWKRITESDVFRNAKNTEWLISEINDFQAWLCGTELTEKGTAGFRNAVEILGDVLKRLDRNMGRM